ncbi:coproporphyrinogen III oxidase [Actibacterium mucosum KCTC 23349]|uniref:Heme chaperone HemW n=1 Tax=Actibacterium mucosum KCTC 23349 TaxID=1454373 RepID=A0A037ZNM2_9RHOB|nr:radical SAM family heme chaperone HemW [Actibacterium mucosum]KAJ57255.1 coproporphyrinogen III oxidase [Actibacterium mucosum KCTC 23349]
MTEDWQHGGFGLYIHWPFCQAKCPYCDFNSHVAAKIDQSRWKSAYLAEIQRVAAELPNRVLNTIYFGGGTPSLMDPDLVGDMIAAIRGAWPTANDIEITLEANPGSVETGRFAAFRDAGINRVSVGIQALNDADLRALGRIHSVAEARKAIEIAQSTFDRSSFDLIYARQNQSLADWQAELREALAMAADHLSLYQLTIEDGTAFGDRLSRGGLRGLPDEDLAGDMYFATQEICDTAGYPAYEVSNHAALGSESRHNLIYWRYGDYAGIGPGAHGRVTVGGQKFATETHLAPGKWLNAVEETGNGENLRDAVSGFDQAGEYLMFGLRILDGVDLKRLNGLYRDYIAPQKLLELLELGLVARSGDTLRTTAKGRPVLNAVIRNLLPEV